ncbi:MAG: hycX [Myxococcaceae bacterium]|nr:hycX [Myxococcaceae bacterium]
MTYLLIAYLLVVLVPMFVASWRTSLLGLAVQGLLLGWMAMELTVDPTLTPGRIALFAELVLVRGVFVPVWLYRVLNELKTPARNDIIPANLLFWTIVGVLVVVSFRFANGVFAEEQASTHLAVAAAALLLGLLVLASQDQPVSQLIGVLRIENAIALFELASEPHIPLPVQLGLVTIFVATVLTFGWYLRKVANAPAEWVEGPAL